MELVALGETGASHSVSKALLPYTPEDPSVGQAGEKQVFTHQQTLSAAAPGLQVGESESRTTKCRSTDNGDTGG